MLAIISTHPIQYQVPIWKELARRGRVPTEVIFLCDHGQKQSFDKEFGRAFTWDIDLLAGYPSSFVNPGSSPSDFNGLHLSPAIVQRLARLKPRAIWIQGWQVAGYWEAAAVAKLVGAELWLRGETNLNSGAPSRRRLRNAGLTLLFALVSRFLFIGRANRAFYLSRGISEARLTPAPYCVDNSRFRAAAAEHRRARADIRRNWSIAEDAFCFLFVGKFIMKKRPMDLLEAAGKLRARKPGRKVHLLWVGEGHLLDQARARADELSSDTLTSSFAGFLNQSEITKAYCAADCLILPSEADETWGLVVNEAMASGLPAIISDACGCAHDLAITGHEEMIFPMGDVDALADVMGRALERLPSAEEIATKIDAYDMIKTVDAVEALYLEAFGR